MGRKTLWVALLAVVALAAPVGADAVTAPNWTYAWGANGNGQLGRATFTSWEVQPGPAPAVSGIAGQRIVALSVGSDHVLAARIDGTVWAWGGNGIGQLGNGSTTASATPVQVMQSATTPLSNVKAVAAGWQFSLALKNDGTVWAWGRNANGELGDGTLTDRAFAAEVTDTSGAALAGVRAIAAGWGYAVAAKTDKSAWEWGRPLWRQVGAASSSDRLAATDMKANGLSLSAGWGGDEYGPPFDICALAIGKWHAIALDCNGMVETWGLDDVGQLGQSVNGSCNGGVASPCRPNAGPRFLTDVVAVAAGDDYSLALKNDGTVWAWGANWYGMLGDGTTTNHMAPAPVTDTSGAALSGITAIAGGEFHALARKGDGSVVSWGLAAAGRLGTSSGLQICTTNSQPCAKQALQSGVPAGVDVLDAIAAGGTSSALAGGPLVTVLPGSKSLNFPFQPTLVESAKKKISVFNRASVPLSIAGVTSYNTRFLATNACSAPVQPDTDCDVDVSFKPYVGGSESGLLDLSHPSVGTGTTTITLTGSAIPGSAAFHPSQLAFGATGVSKQRVLTVTLENSGPGGIVVGQMYADHPDFSVGPTTCGAQLAGGASCTIDVRYQPSSLGAIAGNLVVQTPNLGTSSASVPLSGSGVSPSATVSAGSLNFGGVNQGSQTVNQVALTNTGSVPLGVNSVTIIGNQQFKTTGCPTSVAVGGACTVTVTFAPTIVGPAHATLRFDDDAGPHDVLLDGVGVAVGVPVVVPNIVSAGILQVRTKSQVFSVQLGNTGSASFTVGGVGIGSPHVRDFDIVGDTCTGQSVLYPTKCAVSVVFTPLATGPRNATLDIWTSAGAVHVDLRGTGDAGGLTSKTWAQFGFAPGHGGFPIEETGIDTSSVAKLSLAWQEQTKAPVESSPAVADGLVFWGSGDGSVYACSPAKGGVVWTFATGGAVRSSPAVERGVVYVGSDDGNVYALEAATGTQVWTAKTGGAVVSSPTVLGGVVYVGSTTSHVLALDAASGGIVWDTPLNSPVETSPAVADGVVYATDLNRVRALDARTGALLWTAFTNGVVHSSPTVSSGHVFVGSDGGTVYSLAASTGATVWAFPLGSAVASSPAVADGVVYVGSDDTRVYALDAATGAPLWVTPLGGAVRSSPAVANGVVYVGADDAEVHALEAWTGDELWREKTQGVVRSSPAVAEGRLYIGSDDGSIYAFQP